MAYDRDSFLAGLAVGRTLWKPHNTDVVKRGDSPRLIKALGGIKRTIVHNHAGDYPPAKSGDGSEYLYEGEHSYTVNVSFSLVLRTLYNANDLNWAGTTGTMPATPWPLTTSNSKFVYPYEWSTNPMLPNGDGVHPLLNSPDIGTYVISQRKTRIYIGAELLIYIDISAPPICPWESDACMINGSQWTDVNAIPNEAYLEQAKNDVNGLYHMKYTRIDPYYDGVKWTIKRQGGDKGFTILLAPWTGYSSGNFTSYIKICNAMSSYANAYSVPYTVTGVNLSGVQSTAQVTYKQGFNYANVPFTELVYQGPESEAPIDCLHPSVDDLEIS